jgi:hypothetical protein
MHEDDLRVTGVATSASRNTEIGAASPRATDGNPAAPKLQPLALVRGFFGQFGHPSGWFGGLAGLLQSRTVGDDRWVVDLLNVQATDQVLDIGCGPGVTLQLLAERAGAGFLPGSIRQM